MLHMIVRVIGCKVDSHRVLILGAFIDNTVEGETTCTFAVVSVLTVSNLYYWNPVQ